HSPPTPFPYTTLFRSSLHIMKRAGRPQRGPAGAHGGDEVGFVADAEKRIELAGERGVRRVLEQCRRAHGNESAGLGGDPSPRIADRKSTRLNSSHGSI